MPFVFATYREKLIAANPINRAGGDPVLGPLNALLQAAPAVLNGPQRRQITEALGRIPFAAQQRYIDALGYARQQLRMEICSLPYAYPVDLVHTFDYYEVAEASWGGPMDRLLDGWFSHNMRLTWRSSNGNMASLANIRNRESVTYLQPAMGPPFRAAMLQRTPQVYVRGDNPSSSHGFGSDNHSFMNPSLMLQYPVAPAVIQANQEYEYSPDGGLTWYEIEYAQFEFDRGVRPGPGNRLYFFFCKRNRRPRNNRVIHFEIEYPIGAQPPNPPANRDAVHGEGSGRRVVLGTYGNLIANV